MAKFVEISNEQAIRNVNLVGCPEYRGYATTTQDWVKHGFYPKAGVVGQVVGEAQSREGLLYLIQVSDSIIVAVLPYGLRNISYIEANKRYPSNMAVGHIVSDEAEEYELQAIQNEIDNLMQSFM
ncbi:MAG: hypothetical protein ACI30H_06470 [Paludibacteraceae bacterium]